MLKRTILLSLLLTLAGVAGAVKEVKTIIHTDHLGSPIMGRSMDGETLWERHYEPYGSQDQAPGDPASAGYTGHLEERDSGLVYAGARWYDPRIGRFMSPDPVGFSVSNPVSFNRYAYANNNPYAHVDPDGRDAVGIVYKGYEVNTGMGFKLPLGHAGVLLINENNGLTRYYEYGRYDPRSPGIIGEALPKMEGNVRNVTVPNVEIADNGKPTPESLEKVYSYLSRHSGQGKEVDVQYYEDADFRKMEAYVDGFANNKKRKGYSILLCNCYIFKDEVIESGNN